MATYPAALYSPTTIIDGVDYPLATHINTPNAEIEAIETELGINVSGTQTNLLNRLSVSTDTTGCLKLTGDQTLTIATGSITLTNNLHKVAVESGTSDYLDTVAAAASGFVAVLSAADSSKPIIIRHNAGNLLTPGGRTITLGADGDFVIMVFSTALDKWRCAYFGKQRLSITTKTTTYTATVNDDILLGDASGAAFTITLPPATSSAGVELTIKKVDASANAVTVDGNASELIDGVTTKALSSQYQSITVVCDGSAYWTK